ncbi:MAG: 50S ribosomal protein L4 [Patescibacteria group bacterium]
MSKVKIYNQEGKNTGELDLNPKYFDVLVKPALVHEVVVAQEANRRKSIAHTKTKGEVRGGGKKPWKQKGTGRARQGSIRSPQWVGGGIVFGPRGNRNFSVKVNRRVRQSALFMALSDKVKNEKFLILESFSPSEPKTKQAVSLFSKLPIARKVLAVIPKSDPILMRMVRNIPNVKLQTVNSLNLMDLLAYPTVIFWKDAVPAFESLYRNA